MTLAMFRVLRWARVKPISASVRSPARCSFPREPYHRRRMASHPNLIHLDDVDGVRSDRDVLRGTRYRIGAAAGCARIGLSRYVLGPGERAMPVHVHADEEEIFY